MFFFFFKQKTAYEMRISDWSSDVCSSDLNIVGVANGNVEVSVAGSVANNVQAVPLGAGNTSNKTTVTLDSKGGLLERVDIASGSAVAGDSTIAIAATGKIGGNVDALATGAASISHAGTVGGSAGKSVCAGKGGWVRE